MCQLANVRVAVCAAGLEQLLWEKERKIKRRVKKAFVSAAAAPGVGMSP